MFVGLLDGTFRTSCRDRVRLYRPCSSQHSHPYLPTKTTAITSNNILFWEGLERGWHDIARPYINSSIPVTMESSMIDVCTCQQKICSLVSRALAKRNVFRPYFVALCRLASMFTREHTHARSLFRGNSSHIYSVTLELPSGWNLRRHFLPRGCDEIS